jgi:hypothetical protein
MRFGPRRRASAIAALAALGALATLAAFSGCAGSGPPRIPLHGRCVSCGMGIEDLRFACERPVNSKWRAYDAVECLIHDTAKLPGGPAWLSDYDTRALHAADSMWVVKGEFPTPMSGGFAAFARRSAADSVAALTHGQVGRFATWLERGWP